MSKSHSQKCYSILKSILDYAMKFYDLEKNPATIAGPIKMFETQTPFSFLEKVSLALS